MFHLDRLVSLNFVPGRLSSNSCSAALICVSCATRRIRFLFQTFSRNDPPGRRRRRGAVLSKKKQFRKNRFKAQNFKRAIVVKFQQHIAKSAKIFEKYGGGPATPATCRAACLAEPICKYAWRFVDITFNNFAFNCFL